MWNLNVKTALGIAEKECCYNLLCCRPVASSWSSWSSVWSAWSASSSTSPSAPMPWHQAWREASSWCLLMTSKHSCLDCFAKLLNLVTGFLIYVTFNCGKMCNIWGDKRAWLPARCEEQGPWTMSQRFWLSHSTSKNSGVNVCTEMMNPEARCGRNWNSTKLQSNSLQSASVTVITNAEIHVREAFEWLFAFHFSKLPF